MVMKGKGHSMKNVLRASLIWTDRALEAAIVIWLGLILVLAATQIVAPVFDHQTIVIRGRSMEPTLPFASLIIIDRTPETLERGDIVTFRADNDVLVTHRVTEVLEDGAFLRTHGDANPNPDPRPIATAQVVGEVAWSAPLLGYPLGILSSPLGFASLMLALLALSLDWFWLRDTDAEGRNNPTQPSTASKLVNS